MSKLKDKYFECKKDDKEKVYLFDSGIFYLFLGEDAIKMSDIFNLKLTLFTSDLYKCGFPKTSLNKYKEMFKEKNLEIEIVEKDKPTTYTDEFYQTIVDKIKSIDLNNITPLDSMKLLKDIQDKL